MKISATSRKGVFLLANIVTQIRALRALGLIHEEATVAVPVLVQHVETETNWLLLSNYLQTLGGFGTNARVAVPVLLHQLESNPNPTYYPVRRQMVAALAQIDLEAAKPYLIQDKTNSTNVGTIRDDFGLFRKTNSGIIK